LPLQIDQGKSIMKARSLVALASVVALCACNSGGDRDRDRDRDDDRGSRSERDRGDKERTADAEDAEDTGGSTGGNMAEGGGDSQLEQEIAQAVEVLRPRLPIQSGPTSITNVEARGMEMLFHVSVPNDIDQTSFERVEQAMTQQACANPQAKQLFERGGAYSYLFTDSGGEEFRTTIRSC
jgi:hypothetical protein